MKKTELLPTNENLITSLRQDSIKRNDDLLYFVSLLDNITGPYSIALDGRWGSGKTFFVKQTQMVLNVHNEYSQVKNFWETDDYEQIKRICYDWSKKNKKENFVSNLQLCTYFDAWEHDSDENPIASLLYEISNAVSSEYSFEGNRNCIDIISNALNVVTGRDVQKLIESLKKKTITDETKTVLDLRSQINKYFENLLPEHGDRIVVIIDELDRCNPCYAVNLLEKIKHYFSNEKITFVFAVNMEQLQHTIKHHYGNEFNAYKYLDRFFDLIIPMPKLNQDTFLTTLPYDRNTIVYEIAEVFVKQYKMEMREISKYYSTLNVVAKHRKGEDVFSGGSKQVCFNFFVPIALGLQKYDINMYYDFINGKNVTPLIDVLCSEELKNYVPHYLGIGNNQDLEKGIRDIYDAFFIKAIAGQRTKVHGFYYDDSVVNYFNRIIGMLNATANFE